MGQLTSALLTHDSPATTPAAAVMSDDEKKPEIKGEQINLKVKDQDGQEVHFKVKKNTKMEKIFKAYATKKQIAAESIKFLFDGTRIKGHQTPDDLELEDGDEIDAMLEQVGGRAQ